MCLLTWHPEKTRLLLEHGADVNARSDDGGTATARKSGFTVNEQIARTQTKKTGSFLETWRERVLQGVGMGGESITIGYILAGLAAGLNSNRWRATLMRRGGHWWH